MEVFCRYDPAIAARPVAENYTTARVDITSLVARIRVAATTPPAGTKAVHPGSHP